MIARSLIQANDRAGQRHGHPVGAHGNRFGRAGGKGETDEDIGAVAAKAVDHHFGQAKQVGLLGVTPEAVPDDFQADAQDGGDITVGRIDHLPSLPFPVGLPGKILVGHDYRPNRPNPLIGCPGIDRQAGKKHRQYQPET